jgi:putative transposase
VTGQLVKRGYKYRFYPSDQQEHELLRTFGCVRLVYNKALEARTAAWYTEQRRVNCERGDRKRVAKAQRQLARKAKGSANRVKARVKVARIHARITDRRRDHLHKLSTRLVRENQTIVIEDLNVLGMVGNHSLARAISDAAWSDLRNMLEYKAEWYGRTVIAVDQWFPSSKTCSECGALLDTLPLHVREWTCRCGAVHDRDVNAACNILAAGRAVNACGDGVRPQRESSRTGRSSMKQETQRVTAGIPSL